MASSLRISMAVCSASVLLAAAAYGEFVLRVADDSLSTGPVLPLGAVKSRKPGWS